MDDPTQVQLTAISAWPANDLAGLMEFIKPIWEYADCGYYEVLENNTYKLHTAGWSGNEEIIFSMQQNHVWWMMYWWESQRGGHYTFCPVRDGIGNMLIPEKDTQADTAAAVAAERQRALKRVLKLVDQFLIDAPSLNESYLWEAMRNLRAAIESGEEPEVEK